LSRRPQPDEPSDRVTALARLLDALLEQGIPHAADLVASTDGRALIDHIRPPRIGAGTVHDRAIATHRVVIASVAALGAPDAPMLEALFDLQPAARPRHRRLALTLTERREQAGAVVNRAAETVRKGYEPKLLKRLALEIHRRTTAGVDTTRGSEDYPRLHLPPPPADLYRPTRPPRPSRRAEARRS